MTTNLTRFRPDVLKLALAADPAGLRKEMKTGLPAGATTEFDARRFTDFRRFPAISSAANLQARLEDAYARLSPAVSGVSIKDAMSGVQVPVLLPQHADPVKLDALVVAFAIIAEAERPYAMGDGIAPLASRLNEPVVERLGGGRARLQEGASVQNYFLEAHIERVDGKPFASVQALQGREATGLIFGEAPLHFDPLYARERIALAEVSPGVFEGSYAAPNDAFTWRVRFADKTITLGLTTVEHLSDGIVRTLPHQVEIRTA